MMVRRGWVLWAALVLTAGCTRTVNLPLAVDEDNWEVEILRSDKPVLVDFWTSYCLPCKEYEPAVDQVAEEYLGRVRVAQIDAEAAKSISKEYGVEVFPSFLMFHNGKEVARQTGTREDVSREDQLRQLIESALPPR